ncbi:MAG: aldehyde-activating protein [Gammaproteobacteria bacterium]|nr:aldehyde-activating protein [Gammaproteobacteria bacterium]
MNNVTEGGCFCGSVRYSFESDNYLSSNCHCSMCRRTSGAAFLSWMAIPLTAFEYGKGNPKNLISSAQGTRYFCQDCGTPLTCLLDEYPKYIYVTICSLDNPQDFEPGGGLYVEDMLNWVKT